MKPLNIVFFPQYYSKNMDENNEYYQCFRIILNVLKILGINPFLFSHQGTSKNLFVSRILTILALMVFCVLCGEQYIYVAKNVKLIFVNFQFDIFVRIIPPIISRIIYLFIPVMSWQTSKPIYKHIKRWKTLQDTLSDIQRAEFLLPFKNLIHAATIITLIITFLVLLPLQTHFDVDIVTTTSVPSFVFLGLAVISMVVLWLTNCIFVVLVARNVLVLINKSIASEDEDSLMKLIEFWENLYDWNAEFTSTTSVAFLIVLINMVVTMVACFYTFTYLVFVEEDRSASIAYFTFAIATFTILVIYCESANYVLNQIATVIHESILITNLKGMNRRILKVILIFLQTNEAKKPKIMVNGVMNLHRSSIISICSSIINSLIVLKQFNPQG